MKKFKIGKIILAILLVQIGLYAKVHIGMLDDGTGNPNKIKGVFERDDANGIVKDKVTGLWWQDDSEAKTVQKLGRMPKNIARVWLLEDTVTGNCQISKSFQLLRI